MIYILIYVVLSAITTVYWCVSISASKRGEDNV